LFFIVGFGDRGILVSFQVVVCPSYVEVFELSFVHAVNVKSYAVDFGVDVVDDDVVVLFSVV
jgi:hypothetical protein